MKNRLVVIGWVGSKRVYLNVPKEEAIQRYLQYQGQKELCGEDIEVYEFDDEFEAYSIWAEKEITEK